MPLTDNIVTRFPGGVTNVPVGDIFSSLRGLDPTAFHTFFNDFDTYAAGDWTVTETQAGATQALTAGDGGLMLLTNSAANNDINQLQNSVAHFLPVAGKKFFFKTRLKLSDATASFLAVGVQNANVDGSTLATATDGFFFRKGNGVATLDVHCRKDNSTGAASASAIATLVDDTFITLALFYDGIDRMYYAVNGTVLGYLDASATYLPDANLAVIVSVKNGAAAAKNGTIDYLFAAQER